MPIQPTTSEERASEVIDSSAEHDGLLGKPSEQLADARRKHLETEKKYDLLKSLAKQALQEFEDLKVKCNDNYEQCVEERRAHDVTKQDLKTVREELQKLREKSQQAYEEYGEFQDKLDLEKELRNKAEEYAQDLQEESQRLIEKLKETGASVPADSVAATVANDDDEPSKKDLKKGVVILHEQWEEAEERSAKARAELEKVAKELARMKAEEEKASLGLKREKEELDHLKELSRMAYGEYEQLQAQLTTEREIRLAAEAHAHKQLQESNMVKRQSALILNTATEDERIAAAFSQLQELNEEVSTMKRTHAKVVDDLKQEITRLENLQQSKTLEEKLILAEKQREMLEKKEREAEHRASVSEQRVQSLQTEVQSLREAIASAAAAAASGGSGTPVAAPPPPPPPPPPLAPPPPPLQPISKIVLSVRGGKKGGGKTEPPKADARAQAMDEMMERIRSGKTGLKPRTTAEPRGDKPADDKSPKDDMPNAMSQIAAMIKQGPKLRATKTPERRQTPSPSAMSSELQKKLERRQKKNKGDATDGGDDSSASSKQHSEIDSPMAASPTVTVAAEDTSPGQDAAQGAQETVEQAAEPAEPEQAAEPAEPKHAVEPAEPPNDSANTKAEEPAVQESTPEASSAADSTPAVEESAAQPPPAAATDATDPEA